MTTRQFTRDEILRLLKEQGQATVEQLASSLGLTPMGIRQHLGVLEREGLIAREALRGRPGRPPYLYRPTPRVEDVFPKQYGVLAGKLADWLEAAFGPDGKVAVYEAVGEMLADEYRHRMGGKELGERVAEVSEILNEHGCLAAWEPMEGGYALRWHNCPYYRVAQKHREICQMDRVFLRSLLGASVKLGQCLLDDEACCTLVVRPLTALANTAATGETLESGR